MCEKKELIFANTLLWREGRAEEEKGEKGGGGGSEREERKMGWGRGEKGRPNEMFIFTTVANESRGPMCTLKEGGLVYFNMLAHELLITRATEENYVTQF